MELIKPILPPTPRNQEDIYEDVRRMVREAFFVPSADMPRLNEREVRLRIQLEALSKEIDRKMIDMLLEFNNQQGDG